MGGKSHGVEIPGGEIPWDGNPMGGKSHVMEISWESKEIKWKSHGWGGNPVEIRWGGTSPGVEIQWVQIH